MINHPPHLLLIEDEPDIRETLAELLELHGYRVVQASQGQEGITKALDQVPDLVLCDVMMPGLDGFETVARMRQHPQLVHLPIIFLTARAEIEDLRRGMSLGADDYLYKPVGTEELISAIETRLRRQRQISQEKSATIERLRTRLNEQQAALDTYTHLNSHALRAPIARMLGLVEIFLKGLEQQTPETQAAMLKALEDTAQEIDAVVRQINEVLAEARSTTPPAP